jgi:fermentation-respiration switch protein FrsA (DUF1100 family)
MMSIVLATVGAFCLALVLLLWWQQERIVFQPSGPPFPTVRDVEQLRYRASDGQELFAFVVRAPSPSGVVLAFHGNADLAAWTVPWALELTRRTGWSVMLAEYRGYGGLSGQPTVPGVRLDARAAWELARDSLGATPERLALYGHSLGSAVASELAAEVAPSRLVLDSPFTSARDMARIVVARPVEWVWTLISRVPYDTRARVAALDRPVWVSHGQRDLVIPVRMGREVFDAARMKGELVVIEGAGHNDLANAGGERYWSWLERALSDDVLAGSR